MEDSPGSYCGRVKVTTPSPTPAPTPAAEPNEYDVNVDARCKKTDEAQKTKRFKFDSQNDCQSKCDAIKKCKSYQWNGKNGLCVIFKNTRAEAVQLSKTGTQKVCAIVSKNEVTPTSAPTKMPTQTSSKAPVARRRRRV